MTAQLTDEQIDSAARQAGATAYKNRFVTGSAFSFGPESLRAFVDAIIAADRALREQAHVVPAGLTLKAFEAMLVGSRVVDHDAIHESEGYDDGEMRGRVYALYQRLISAPQAQPERPAGVLIFPNDQFCEAFRGLIDTGDKP